MVERDPISQAITGETRQRLGRPAQVTRRSRLEAFQDDVNQATEGNPVFELLGFAADNLGPFLGAEPGGPLRAAFKFIPRRVEPLTGGSKGVSFLLKDPESSLGAVIKGAGEISPSGRKFNISSIGIDPMKSSSRAVRQAQEGPEGLVGTRGMLEAVRDFARKFPKVEEITSASRGTGSRGQQLERLTNDIKALGRLTVRAREAGNLEKAAELADKADDLRKQAQELHRVNIEVPERFSTAPEREMRQSMNPPDQIPDDAFRGGRNTQQEGETFSAMLDRLLGRIGGP